MDVKYEIKTNKAPKAIGPYSQAIEMRGIIYTSGVIPVDPDTDEIPEGIKAQTQQALRNLRGLLEAEKIGMHEVVRVTLFIKNMDDFDTINEVYAKYFEEPYPARVCVEVARLPKDVLIEIEAIAIMPEH